MGQGVHVTELPGIEPGRLMQRLEHRVGRLETDRDDATAGAASARHEAERAAARLGQPFEHADRLEKLAIRQAELERLLAPEPETVHAPSVVDRLAAVRGDPPARSR